MRMSNAEVNRLGDRLRASPVVSSEDLDLLQVLRKDYESALHDAQEAVTHRFAGLAAPTSGDEAATILSGRMAQARRTVEQFATGW